MDTNKEDTIHNLHLAKEDLKERIGDLDKLYSEQIEEINVDLDKVRSIAKDSVAAKEKELQDLMTT